MPRPFRLALLSLSALALAPAAHAQSFDCSKAKTPVEIAICAAPDLAALDSQLAKTYAAKSQGAQSDSQQVQLLRAAQREWIAARDQSCLPLAVNDARFSACLREAYGRRLAALAQAPAVSGAPAAAGAPAAPQTPAAQTAPAAPPPSASVLAQLPASPPAPDAALSRASVPASADAEALAEVKAAGRFSIRATSKTGVALQLVDMIAGPGDISGDAGSRDGRLDVLLDKGTYKLRSFGAKQGSGEAALSVQPFLAAAAPASGLLRGGQMSAELGDLQSRAFWVLVDASQRLSVEAAGRSLADLRAWRNGADLAELKPAASSIEPKAGHPLTRLRLDGAVEPGLYLVMAYGGPALPWADGSGAQPFHIRSGPPAPVVAGWVEGILGPLGVTRFEASAPASYFRLELPEPAAARLSVARGGGSPVVASIAKNSREPVASASLAASGQTGAVVEISGSEGQPFRLRALNPSSSLRIEGAGPHLVAVDVAGEGGDEVPATVLLARFQAGAGAVLASSAPKIGPGAAWRKKFNLRGPTSLIFEITAAGPVAATISGAKVAVSLDPVIGGRPPRSDGKAPMLWDVEPGWYQLKLDLAGNPAAIIDLTFGQPGLAGAIAPAPEPRSTIDLGLHVLEKPSLIAEKPAYFQIFSNSAPGLVTGPRARLLPADLAAAPVSLLQGARPVIVISPTPVVPAPLPIVTPPKPGAAAPAPALAAAPKPAAPKPEIAKPAPLKPAAAKPLPPKPAPVELAPRTTAADGSLTLAVRAPVGGRILVTDASGKPVDFSVANENIDKAIRSVTLKIAPSEKARSVIISFAKTVQPAPLPATAAQETAQALGAGKPVFFDLAEGARRSFTLDIPEGGLYRLETLGRLMTGLSVSTSFLPKLDAAEDNGPGHNALVQTFLRAGAYRVRVEAQKSAGRLGLLANPAPLLDAGNLTPEASLRATLPQGSGAAIAIEIVEAGNYRVDLYGLERTFTARLEDAQGWPLAPPGELRKIERRFEPGRYRLVVLPEDVEARLVARLRKVPEAVPIAGHGPHRLPFDSVTAFQWREPAVKDGPRVPDRWEFEVQGAANVTLELSDGMIADLLDVTGAPKSVAKIVNQRGYAGALPAGRYALEARSVGRNDRLDYEIDLRAKEIQPGSARAVDLPVTIPFAIAAGRVVSFTSFGRTQMQGILRDADGREIERLSGRRDDWNIGLSRILPAGAYTLDLSEASANVGTEKPAADDEDKPAEDSGDAPEKSADAPAASDEDKLELRFDLPATAAARALGFAETVQATGPNVHIFNLPPAAADSLLVIAARSSAELVAALERRDSEGTWRALAFDRSRTPVIAVPGDGDGANPWRVSVWAIDGGAAALTIAARDMRASPQPLGEINLAALDVGGLVPGLRLASVAAPGQSLVALKERVSGLMQGSRPGRALSVADSEFVAPQSGTIWLLSRDEAAKSVRLDAMPAVPPAFALELAPRDIARLAPAAPADGGLRVWRASSTFGQPGISAGRGMGVAAGSALALAGSEPPAIWNAGSREALSLRVESLELKTQSASPGDGHYAKVLAPGAAHVLALPPGVKQVRLDLAANTAAILSGAGEDVTVWAQAATSRQVTGAWTQIVLLNAGAAPVPVMADVVPANAMPALTAGAAMKRFFGAAGSLSLQVSAKPGDRLVTVGGAATLLGTDGRVHRGSPIDLSSAGELVIDHGVGLVVAWIENASASPWGNEAAVAAALPQIAPLSGVAKNYALTFASPMLLHARSSAPVILALAQGTTQSAPEIFAAGAEYHRYLGAGEAGLRLYSPHDGLLAGTLELSATPVTSVGEGLGEAQALAPGATALFSFEVTRASNIGVGIRAEPDRASVRLLDDKGRFISEGIAQLRRLDPGRYLIEARAPADSETLIVRPAVIGLVPPGNGPPPDVARNYLELVGLTPAVSR